MKTLKKICVTCCVLLIATVGYSEEFTIKKLPNGQTVAVCEIHNNPIVTIDTWIRTGSINENDSNNGISHFLEHLFFKGTKTHPAGDMDRILESKGAIVNAATSKDFTHYYITIPSEHFDTALDLHADMLLNPQIPRKELEMERKVVLEEISKDLNNPSKKVYENLNSMMYLSHPYKRRVIGSSKNVETMRREEILEYFNNYYAPSNMTTIVVGNVDAEKTINKIQNSFNQPYKKPTKNLYKREHRLHTQKRNIDYSDTQSGYMIIGFRGANITDKDTLALDVLAEILGGNKSSRLYRNIKEQKNLAISINSSNGSFKDDGLFYITANFNPQNYEKLEKAIFSEIDNLKKYGIKDEELSLAKKKIIQDTYYSRESTANIANELGYIMTLSGSADLYKNYVNEINKISACEIEQVAQKYLGENRSAVSVILPESFKTKQEKTVQKHNFSKISESSGISKYIVDNGTTLLISENKNNDIVAIKILAKGGEFLENISGEGALTANLILKGTKKYSAQEIAQILDENGIQINAKSDSDFFSIDVKTTTAQLDTSLLILEEILNNAIFDNYEIEKNRSEILSKIKQKRDLPMNIAIENLKTSIFENSVYSNSNKILEQSLPKIQRKDIIRFYDTIFDSKNVIVSVNGNVDPNKLAQAVGNIFSDKNRPKIDYKQCQVTKLNTPKLISKNIKDLQTAWLFIGWQTSGVQEKKDFVTLKIINTLMGSGLSSRLYRNLREQDGLAYQLGTQYSPKMLAGTFIGYIGTNPNSLDYSKKKMLDEINKLKTEFVSDTELNNAKDRLKGGFIVAMETNTEKAGNVGIFEAYGFGYDFLSNYLQMIDEVTASDIVKVANKYFTSNFVISEVR